MQLNAITLSILAYGNCARGTSGSQNRGVLSVALSVFCEMAGFSFPVTVQNATNENSSILRFVNKSKSL